MLTESQICSRARALLTKRAPVGRALRYDRHMGNNSVQGFLVDILKLFNSTIIPLIFAVAVFFFIWNAARYFIFNGENEAGQDSAKRLALYGIAALVIMLSLWGIVNMVSGAFGIGRATPICPDFNPNCFRNGSGYSSGGSYFGTDQNSTVQIDVGATLQF